MNFRIDFTKKAKEDIEFFRKSGNKSILKKLFNLLNNISEHPYIGIGKPEQLKHQLTGYWSRRINLEHRIIYEVKEVEQIIIIHSVRGHY